MSVLISLIHELKQLQCAAAYIYCFATSIDRL